MINLIRNPKRFIAILVTKIIWRIFLLQQIFLSPLYYIRNLYKSSYFKATSFELEHVQVPADSVPVPQISVPVPEIDRKSDNFEESLKQNKFHQRFKKTKRNVRV